MRLFVMAVAGWWADQRQATVAYLVEENRIRRGHLCGRIRLTDEERKSSLCPPTQARPGASQRSPGGGSRPDKGPSVKPRERDPANVSYRLGPWLCSSRWVLCGQT